MKTFTSLDGWRLFRRRLRGSIGLVPTMGALHEGHLALVQRSLADNRRTVVTIFVNPTQFNQADDLEAYPRALQRDLEMLATAGVDAVLLPEARELYADAYRYRVTESQLSRRLCGAHRPGHFDGVLTVVMKLINLVRPARTYFGEKDYQQLELVRGMVNAFFLDTEIVACPVERAPDGLALSSRNQRLDERQRSLAPAIHRTLCEARDPVEARCRLEELGFDVDYVEDYDGRRLAAARLGEVRLIDNVPL